MTPFYVEIGVYLLLAFAFWLAGFVAGAVFTERRLRQRNKPVSNPYAKRG